MTKGDKRSITALLLLFSVAWVACTQTRQPCAQPKTVYVNAACYHVIADTGNVAIVADTLLPNPLIGVIDTAGKGALFYYGQRNIFQFSMFLNPNSDTCRWFVNTDSTFTSKSFDTLTFVYQSKLQFLSNACGYTYYYNLLGVSTTHNNIDSIILENTNVTSNVNVEHLKIYIHPNF